MTQGLPGGVGTKLDLFDRVAALTVDTLKITELRISWHIEKTLTKEPNIAEMRIWNMTPDQRSHLEELGKQGSGKKVGGLNKSLRPKTTPPEPGIPVKLEAGYKSGTSQLWLGDLRFAQTLREGTDWVTTVSTGDGGKAFKTARVNVSFGPKTEIDTALRAIVRALGIGEGNVGAIAAKLKAAGAAKLLSQGGTISGNAARKMEDWARSADLEWSIQDGSIQLINRGKVLDGTAIRLSQETGLVDSPSVDSEGVLTAKTLLIPDVRVGGLVVMDAERVKGNYKILKATWDGDTRGTDWYVTIEAARY